MSDELPGQEPLALNYYNYFTEVEEHFRMARNSGMFMMSPIDWALVEAWKDAGIPIEAVLKGIDRAFENYHTGKRRTGTVNSLAYCTQAVFREARALGPVRTTAVRQAPSGLEPPNLAGFFRERADQLRRLVAEGRPGSEVFRQTARSLEGLAAEAEARSLNDLESIERRLTVMEDRVVGVAAAALSEDTLLAARRELDAQLKAYRRKMTAEQIAMLERKFMRRSMLEDLGLSRLSLFYVD